MQRTREGSKALFCRKIMEACEAKEHDMTYSKDNKWKDQ
jgi:hypothetical protein